MKNDKLYLSHCRWTPQLTLKCRRVTFFSRGIQGVGFTLIELLIVVAILGVIAAIGVPMLTGYIQDAKRSSAESGLRSIYLMEQDYKREEGAYYYTSNGNQTIRINTQLFSGNKTLDEAGDYYYYIRPYSSGYRAYAQSRSSSCLMNIDHNNKLTKSSRC